MPLKGPGSTGALELTLLHGGPPDQPGPCNGTPDQPGVPPERPGSTGAAIATRACIKHALHVNTTFCVLQVSEATTPSPLLEVI